MTAERVSYYNLSQLDPRDYGSAKRALYYPDHEGTVADALAHWKDHLLADFTEAKQAGELEKGDWRGTLHRRTWARKLNDARRAYRDLR